MELKDFSDNRVETKEKGKEKEIIACLRSCWQRNPIKFAFLAGISLLAAIVIMTLVLDYSYRPQSCIVCHEMKPAHETWKNSFHGPGRGIDDCLGCHTAPGFGSAIKAKLGGLIFLWNHVTLNFEPDIKAQFPVYCVRSGCHTDPWKMDKGSKIRVNHALHISKGYGCVVCHDRIAHGEDPSGMNLPGMKDFCFPCHNDEIAARSKCQFCHIYQDAMLMGNGKEGILQGEPSGHQRAKLTCIDCHTAGCEPKPVQACLACHPEPYIQNREEERAWILRSMKTLEEGIPQIQRALKEDEEKGLDVSQLSGIYTMVNEVYAFIKADNSKGAHNASYSQMLLNNALNRLDYAYLLINENKRRLLLVR